MEHRASEVELQVLINLASMTSRYALQIGVQRDHLIEIFIKKTFDFEERLLSK